MKLRVWTKAIKDCADPKRGRHFFDLVATTRAGAGVQKASAEQARVLAALFSGSQALSALLIAHPDWLPSVDPDVLRFPRRKQGLLNEGNAWLEPLLETRDFGAALARVRQFKERERLRIGARDLARPGNAEEITQEISDLADVCLSSVWRICWLQLTERHGQPWHQDA